MTSQSLTANYIRSKFIFKVCKMEGGMTGVIPLAGLKGHLGKNSMTSFLYLT